MQYNPLEINDLDESTREQAVSKPIDAIINEIKESIDRIAAITVMHPLPKDGMHSMEIFVHSEDYSLPTLDPLQDDTLTEAEINTKDGEQLGILYEIGVIPCDLAVTESAYITPVYRSDEAEHADSLTVEEGVDRLRWKLGKTKEELQAALPEEE